jgi:serine/threonine protein kinase/uncharacterized membrane protein
LKLTNTGSLNNHDHYVGQTLDEKYRLDRLLGQGGMGAVYLATHLGTERYVAVKLITPQFMGNDAFVERFKREARAAGRLRHPNIVDVTDFGFARSGNETIAYLVMEYLDGCTLSVVLREETRLPLQWVVEILEQVCSAVHEAHRQGIVHRDLKPENIWLEPNRFGGYRAKVLDFGIAKLSEPAHAPLGAASVIPSSGGRSTICVTPLAEVAVTGVLVKDKTQLTPIPPTKPETGIDLKTPSAITEDVPSLRLNERMFPAAELTGVGALLGTPLFMSPEQCRGEKLDLRSDIYSLGIVAYQMLSGTPPFVGEAISVIDAHLESAPKPLCEQAPKVPKRISLVIMSALEKNPAARPQSALAFANALRANTDGLSILYRRAFALYCEYFPQVLKLSVLAHIPVILLTLMLIGLQLADSRLPAASRAPLWGAITLVKGVVVFLTGSTITGLIAIIVTQLAVKPLKTVELGPAFCILRRHWRPFLKTFFRAALRIILGLVLLVIPGIVMTARYAMWVPVVLMEGLEKKAALARSRTLASRSWRAIFFAMLFQFLLPAMVEKLIHMMFGIDPERKDSAWMKTLDQLASLNSIILMPLVSIVPALLYLKMRQLGGETLTDVMAQIETEETRSKWEQRIRERVTPMDAAQNERESRAQAERKQ